MAPTARVPTALTDYIKGRQGYDYNEHGRAGNVHRLRPRRDRRPVLPPGPGRGPPGRPGRAQGPRCGPVLGVPPARRQVLHAAGRTASTSPGCRLEIGTTWSSSLLFVLAGSPSMPCVWEVYKVVGNNEVTVVLGGKILPAPMTCPCRIRSPWHMGSRCSRMMDLGRPVWQVVLEAAWSSFRLASPRRVRDRHRDRATRSPRSWNASVVVDGAAALPGGVADRAGRRSPRSSWAGGGQVSSWALDPWQDGCRCCSR